MTAYLSAALTGLTRKRKQLQEKHIIPPDVSQAATRGWSR